MTQDYFAPRYDNMNLRQVLGPDDDERDSNTIRLQLSQDAQAIAQAHQRGLREESSRPRSYYADGIGPYSGTVELAAQIRQQEGMTPQELWETTHLAKATGINFEQARENKNELVRAMHAAVLKNDQGLKELLAASPNLLDYVKNRPPAELAAMIDDKPLWSFEGAQRNFLEEISHAWDMGEKQQERLRLADGIIEGRAGAEARERLEELSQVIEVNSALREDEGSLAWGSRTFLEFLPQLKNLAWAGIEGGAYGLAAGAAGGAALGSVVPGMGTLAGGVTGGKAGMRAGATAGVVNKSYRDNRAEVFLNLLEMQGRDGGSIDEDEARALANLAAFPMAGLDMASLGTATKFIPGWNTLNKGARDGLAKYLAQTPTSSRAVGEALFQGGKSTAVEGITEGLQEGIAIAAEEAAIGLNLVDARGSSPGQALERMGEAFKAGAVIRAPLVAPGTMQRAYSSVYKVRRIQQSLSQEQVVDKLFEIAQNSQTVALAPEAAEQSLAYSAAAAGAPSLYLNPEIAGRVFFQSEESAALAERLGITPETVAESLELGTDLSIPTESAVVHLFNTPLGQELRPHIRALPEVETVRELGELAEAGRFDAEQFAFLDEIFREADESRAAYERRTAIAAPYVQQLEQAGYTPRQAEHSFAPFVAHAEAMAPLFGQTAQEFLAERLRGFSLTRPDLFGMSEEQFNQQALREMSREELARVNPLLAAVRGRLDGRSLRDYDSQGYKSLRALYGPALFKSKSKGGQALDLLADEMVRQNLLPEGSGASELLTALQARPDRAFFQPVNEGVDLEAPVEIIRVTPQFSGVPTWEFSKGSFTKKLKHLAGTYLNKDTGWEVEVTGRGLSHAAGTVAKRRQHHQVHMEAVASLPLLIENAKLVETHQDRKGQGLANVHRMYAGMAVNDDLYTVKLTIKEEKGRRRAEIEGVYRLYDSSIEKKTPYGAAFAAIPEGWGANSTQGALTESAGNPAELQNNPGSKRPAASLDNYTLRQLLEGVNDAEGKAFFQPAYHGSPYKFDNFSLEHVGQGEGNQAYGWGLYFSSRKEIADWYRRELARVKREQGQEVGEGQLYEVDIPEDTQMMDWDIPLIGQRHIEDKIMLLPLEERVRAFGESGKPPLKMNGRKIYLALQKDGNLQYASELLNSVGIKGVRYLDAISNKLGEKKQNYVIFDDKAINILKTYYQTREGQKRGGIRWPDPDRNRDAIIGLFEGKKNLSTVLHEGAHFFLENLAEAAQQESAPAWVRQAWQSLQGKYGFDGYSVPEAAHEAFARAGEAYFREGKAPSAPLESAFQQFRYWLARLYRSLRNLLGAEQLDPELRDIFDRLLATEDELRAMRLSLENTQALPQVVQEAGPTLRAKYDQARDKAASRAENALLARRLAEQRKFENVFRQAASVELDNDPFYRTEEETRAAGGFSWSGLLEYIDEDLAWALRDKWEEPGRKSLFSEQGQVDFLDAATDAGYDSPANYAGALLERPNRRLALQRMVEGAVKEWEANYDPAQVYNLEMDKVLALELEALTGEAQPEPSVFQAGLERRIGLRSATEIDAEYEALKASLRKQNAILGPLVEQYENALKQTAQEAQAAGVLAGEMHQGAKAAGQLRRARENLARARQQERIKRQALIAAQKARQERGKLIQGLRRDAASKSVPAAFKQQIYSILAHWQGLGTPAMRPADYKAIPSLAEFALNYNNLFGEGPDIFPDWLTSRGQLEPGGELAGRLSLEQLRELRQAVKILAHQGRNYNNFLSFERQVRVTEAAAECIAPMRRLTEKQYVSEADRSAFKGRIRAALRGVLSPLTAMRYVFDRADGYVNAGGKNGHGGANHGYVINPLQDALDAELALKKQASARFTAALQPFVGKNLRQGFAIEGLPLAEDVRRLWGGPEGSAMFTKEKVIAVALNMGNQGNLEALRRGYGWTDEHLARIGAQLSLQEWAAVQEVWDAIGELYPSVNQAYTKLNGVELRRVEAKPLTIKAADGTIELRGGYYPLIFDRSLSRQAGRNEEADIMNRMEGVLRSAKPKSGMTNERKGGSLPPRLSLGVIQQHVNDAIHYATHAVALRDLNQLFNVPEYRQAFVRAMGQESYDSLLPWLRYIARPEGPALDGLEEKVDWLARRGTLYAMGLNFKSALLQLTSAGSSVMQIGPGAFARGAFQMITRPRAAYAEVNAKSAYMQNRGMLLDASLAKELDRLTPAGAKGITVNGQFYTLRDLHNASFSFIRIADAAVAYPTWIGAYDQATAQGLPENEALRRANEAVIKAQGSGGSMDVPAFLRKRGWVKLMTAFMTFANNDLNRKAYYFGGLREHLRGGNSQITLGVYMRHVALEYITPVVLSVLLTSALRDGEMPEGEEYLWELLGYTSMGIPIGRDVIRGLEQSLSGRGYGNRIGGSPAYAGLEALVKGTGAAAAALSADNTRQGRKQRQKAQLRAAKELFNSIAFWVGLPAPQLWRSIEGSKAYFVDDAGTPMSSLLGKPRK